MRRLLAVCGLLACATPPAVVPPPDPDADARAVVRGFLQCLESAGAECRPDGAPYDAWAATQLLARLRWGVPTALLATLDADLKAVREPTAVRRAFVQGLQAVEASVRVGECVPGAVRPLFPRGVGPLAEAAVARAGRLGLMAGPGGGEIAALPAVAAPMSAARLVEVACARGARFTLLVAAAAGVHQTVAVLNAPPRLEASAAPTTPLALPVPAGVVSPYLPVREEAL